MTTNLHSAYPVWFTQFNVINSNNFASNGMHMQTAAVNKFEYKFIKLSNYVNSVNVQWEQIPCNRSIYFNVG